MPDNEKRKASDSLTGSSKITKLDILAQKFPKTEERAEFIAATFSKLLGDETVFLKILDQARINGKHRIVNINKGDDISEYYFNWFVDFGAWSNAMKLVQPRRRMRFPWPSAPSSEPKDLGDRALWFPRFKEIQSILANLTSRERLENGLVLLEEEPKMTRNHPDTTSIELRQAIWDNVFPGQPCAKNRPFEVAVPGKIDYGLLVYADRSKRLQHLPPGIRMDVVRAENLKGATVRCLIFGFWKGVVDSPWNRILLAVVYNTAVQWVREEFMTQSKVPISQAFKNLKLSLIHGNIGPSERMKQLSLDKSLVAECDAELALGPYRNQEEHAVFRVSAWLEKEKLLSAAERFRMLRGWCSQIHVNLESLTSADQCIACRRAWEGKIEEWSVADPPLQLSWDEEKKFAAKMAE